MADLKIIVDSSDVTKASKNVNSLDRSVSNLGKTSQISGESTNSAVRGMNQFGAVAQNGGKKLNTFNMQIQQGGYQLQDFVVQLQSGTSFFTAFGQQGSQFAGVFGPQGAVIGAVIAIGSAVGGMAYKMLLASEDVRTLEEKMKDLESTSNDYADALSGLVTPVDAFGDVIGQVAGKVSSLSSAMLEIKKIKFEETLQAVTKLLPAMESSPLGRKLTGMETKNILDLFPEIKQRNSAGDAGRVAADFATAVGRTMEAKGLEAQSEAFENLRLKVLELAGPFKVMNGEQREFYETVVTAQEKIKNVTEANAEANAKIAEEQQKKTEKLNKARFDHLVSSMAAARKLREKEERDAGKLKEAADRQRAADDKVLLTAQAQAEKDLFDTNLKYQKEQRAKDIAEAEKNLDILFRSRTVSFSIRFAGEESVMAQNFDGPTKTKMTYAELKAAGVAEANILGMGVKKPSGGGGGGKSPAEEFAEYLDGLKQQAELEKQLVGLFDEKRAEEEAVIKARQKYGKETVAKQEAELRGTLRQIEAEKERQRVFDEAKAQQEEVASVIADNFGNAFMSIVDGTKSAKEAFKDMARSIIKQLFQILVVEKMVKSIKSFISPSISAAEANGGAWQGGSKIQAYADGGVVGGPTYFPMAGGKTGLMGEAGPEAIMPLKRGANGKLGVQMEGSAGGDVVINQSFNFQANGDDSVKRIIQQQIPRITEATKAAVVDSKRRGGSFGRAF